MRKRNVHVQFWLDKKEAEAFNKKVKRSGLSREAYLRHLVNGLVPQEGGSQKRAFPGGLPAPSY